MKFEVVKCLAGRNLKVEEVGGMLPRLVIMLAPSGYANPGDLQFARFEKAIALVRGCFREGCKNTGNHCERGFWEADENKQ